MNSTMCPKLEPFKKLVRVLRSHLHRILGWIPSRVSNADVEEGTTRSSPSVIDPWIPYHQLAATYHCCARLPLAAGTPITLPDTSRNVNN